MKRTMTLIMLWLMFICSILFIAVDHITAEPISYPKLHVGEKWTYRETTDDRVETMTLVVEGEETVTIRGTSYDVYVIKTSIPFDTSNIEGFMEGSVDSVCTTYVEKNHHNTIKMIYEIKFQLEGNGTIYNSHTFMEFIYEYLSTSEPDSFDVGTSWSDTVKATTQGVWKINGKVADSNTTTRTYTTNYECIKTEKITVETGSFDTNVVREEQIGAGGEYNVWYYSSKVKAHVKEVSYRSDGTINETLELISYDVRSSSQEKHIEDERGILGLGKIMGIDVIFLLLIFIVLGIIVSIVVLSEKRKKKIVIMQQYVQQPTMTHYPQHPPQYAKQRQQQYFCSYCNSNMNYVEHYQRWYCNNCQQYR